MVEAPRGPLPGVPRFRVPGAPVVVLIDHEDSFVYNLAQLIARLGCTAEVVSSRWGPARDLLARDPDAVVLSPGPGRPEDAGCMLDAIRLLPRTTPLLGVCLGHQALAAALGGRIDHGTPTHGKASMVHHTGTGIFVGVANPFEAGRYHSLVVARDAVPGELEITAWTNRGEVMGLSHRTLPRYGVQFHPESILTPEGPRIVANFLSIARPGDSALGAASGARS